MSGVILLTQLKSLREKVESESARAETERQTDKDIQRKRERERERAGNRNQDKQMVRKKSGGALLLLDN